MKSDVVDAIIEIPYRSRNKFEIKNGKIKLERVLYSAMAYPAEYGFIDKNSFMFSTGLLYLCDFPYKFSSKCFNSSFLNL